MLDLDGEATDSAIFPANGRTYSRVCGRINAFQKGVPDSFASADDIQLDDPSWMVSPSLMVSQDHDSTSELSW